MSILSDATRHKLKSVSTATICTALFKRGLHRQFIQDVRPLNSNPANMIGEAFTLRYIPAREDLNPISVFQNRSHPQRKAIEDCPPGAVMVIDTPQGCAGGLCRLDPDYTLDDARGCRCRHRRWVSRFAGNRKASDPDLS